MKTEKMTFEISEIDAVYQCTVCGEAKCIFILPGDQPMPLRPPRTKCPASIGPAKWLPYQKDEEGGA